MVNIKTEAEFWIVWYIGANSYRTFMTMEYRVSTGLHACKQDWMTEIALNVNLYTVVGEELVRQESELILGHDTDRVGSNAV